jgi:hypothetical protein
MTTLAKPPSFGGLRRCPSMDRENVNGRLSMKILSRLFHDNDGEWRFANVVKVLHWL